MPLFLPCSFLAIVGSATSLRKNRTHNRLCAWRPPRAKGGLVNQRRTTVSYCSLDHRTVLCCTVASKKKIPARASEARRKTCSPHTNAATAKTGREARSGIHIVPNETAPTRAWKTFAIVSCAQVLSLPPCITPSRPRARRHIPSQHRASGSGGAFAVTMGDWGLGRGRGRGIRGGEGGCEGLFRVSEGPWTLPETWLWRWESSSTGNRQYSTVCVGLRLCHGGYGYPSP